MSKSKKSKKDTKNKIRYIKLIMHEEYNHELSKFYHRKRWIKESKKFYWKRKRKEKKLDLF